MEKAWQYLPNIERGKPDKTGRCLHGMIPAWCAYCNPIDWKALKRKPIKYDFMFVLIDKDDGEELGIFLDIDEAKQARKEMNEALEKEACFIEVRDGSNYNPDDDNK